MRPMLLLFIALFNSILGLSILFPIIAPLGRQLGLSEPEVGLFSTSYAVMQFALSAYWGRRSERVGRKPVLIMGIVGFAVGFFAFGFVAQLGLSGALEASLVFPLLLASRIVGGAFSSATMPTAQALAADLSERDQRTKAMAVIGAAFGLGVIFGPALGAGVAHLTGSLLAPIYLSASVAVVNAIFVAAQLREPERRVEAEPVRPEARRSLVRRVWPLLGVALGATFASVVMEQTVAFYYQDRLGLDAGETATAVGLSLVGYGFVAVLAQGYIARRVGLSPRTLLVSGLPIAFVGLSLFVFAHGLPLLMVALMLQGLGHGLVLPGVTAALSVDVGDDEQGAVAGLNSSSQGFGRMLGPLIGTGLYQLRMELPYALGAVCVGLVLAAVLVRPSLGRGRPAQGASAEHI